MAINPYFVFDGEAKEAVAYYAEAFGVKDYQVMTFGEAPQHPDHPIPQEAKGRVMHAMLQLPTAKLMFSDTFPGQEQVKKGNQITLAYVLDDEQELRRVFNFFAQEGKVMMSPQETFWSKCYGSVTDRFGIEWQVSYEG
ncbi:VOC family protein [Lysinibacillus sp. KU-BSD001]|uniref:VOC family protein n=1 Tax=Lysinibacillus sp. KU-BSD001 TaxID=3141328 RepID=UPI0036E6AEAB